MEMAIEILPWGVLVQDKSLSTMVALPGNAQSAEQPSSAIAPADCSRFIESSLESNNIIHGGGGGAISIIHQSYRGDRH